MAGIPLSTLHPYTYEFDARVSHVNEDGTVELDRTYFYATSGGQPADTGKIIKNDEEYRVTDVRKNGNFIVHTLERHGLHDGDEVHCVIDRDRRVQLMRMHSATHILCAVIEKKEHTQITSNQLGVDKSRIDLNLEGIDQEKIKQYIDEANSVIAQQIDLRKYTTTREELLKQPELIKLAMGFPDTITDVHMVEVPGCDHCPCGGTHVNNTREIGKIVFEGTENKGKDRKRIYFKLE
jgi:Ser-tRNA(Ala) deacylase AlaX